MSQPNPPITPDLFSPLPQLSVLLSRLRPPPSSASQTNHLSQQSLSSPLPAAAPTPSTPLPGTAITSTSGSLSLKEVPAATDPIKHNLQKARQQVKALPDIGRTVKEQEREIEELEARIREQKAVLGVLKGLGGGIGEEADGGRQGGGDRDMVMR